MQPTKIALRRLRGSECELGPEFLLSPHRRQHPPSARPQLLDKQEGWATPFPLSTVGINHEALMEAHMRHPLLLPIALLLVTACASSGTNKSGQRRDRNVITRAEIDQSPEHSALTLIRTLRPGMLSDRGKTSIAQQDPGIIVFLNGQRYGDLSSLDAIEVSTIQEIRFLDAAQAQQRYGMGYPQGVILITGRTR